jgi:hypothetical protein
MRQQLNPPPDYTQFPSFPFDLWKRAVYWAKSCQTTYSREVQELFQFFDQFPRGPSLEPLYSYLFNTSNYFGQDLVSFRLEKLKEWTRNDLRREDVFWRLQYSSVVDKVIWAPTEFHVGLILLRHTDNEKRLEEFLSIVNPNG